jgi:hypothetical protein
MGITQVKMPGSGDLFDIAGAVQAEVVKTTLGGANTTFADSTARAAATPIYIGELGLQKDTGAIYRGTALTAGSWTLASSGSNTGDQTNITGNAATVTTNANLTGPVTSVGNATAIAAMSSSAFFGIINDETGGSGLVVGNASPTFSTQITVPKVLGGTGTTQSLTFQTTSGVGAAGADHVFKVGNNGATEAMRILNSGFLGVGVVAPAWTMHIVVANNYNSVGDGGQPALALGNSSGTNESIYLVPANDNCGGFVCFGGYPHGTGTVSNGFPSQISSSGPSRTMGVFGWNSVQDRFFFMTASAGSDQLLNERMTIKRLGNVGIGQTSPTAVLHIKAGTSSASGAPLKLTSGTRLTTPEAGVIEYNGNHYLTNAAIRFGAGGSIFDHIADNTGDVSSGETTLYTDTLAASTFNANGDKVESEYGGLFVSSATATRQVRVYLAGTSILDTGTLTLTLSSAWTCYVTLIRVSSSVIRYMISFTTEGAALAAYTAVGELTGLTLSATNILKITGQSAGTGSATGDIVGKMGLVEYSPAA